MVHYVIFIYSCIQLYSINIHWVPLVEGMVLSDKQNRHDPWPQGAYRFFFFFLMKGLSQENGSRSLCVGISGWFTTQTFQWEHIGWQRGPLKHLWSSFITKYPTAALLCSSYGTHFQFISPERNLHNLLSVISSWQ